MTPPELSIPRQQLGHLLAARSGHGDFAEYHRRLKREDALLMCSCGADKTPRHFLEFLFNPNLPPYSRDPEMDDERWCLAHDDGI